MEMSEIRQRIQKNQDHYCVKPVTIDEYIAAQEDSVRPKLECMRVIIHDAIPDAAEKISWSRLHFRSRETPRGLSYVHKNLIREHPARNEGRKFPKLILMLREYMDKINSKMFPKGGRYYVSFR